MILVGMSRYYIILTILQKELWIKISKHNSFTNIDQTIIICIMIKIENN